MERFRYLWFVVIAMLMSGATLAQDRVAWWMPESAHKIVPVTGDGQPRYIQTGGSECMATQEEIGMIPWHFLYFRTDDSLQAASDSTPATLYATVEYFDNQPYRALTMSYVSDTGEYNVPAAFRIPEKAWGGWYMNTQQWQTAVFELAHPVFNHAQFGDADFRIGIHTGGGRSVCIRSVTLTKERPANVELLDNLPLPEPRVRVEPPQTFCMGTVTMLPCWPFNVSLRDLRAASRLWREAGVTSHEIYVQWGLCEPEEGKFDFSLYDRYMPIHKEAGLKWLPFLIVSSPYAIPQWFYKNRDLGFQGYVCQEHQEESDVQSMWAPATKAYLLKFLSAFFAHYDASQIESVLLGITGNYGETLYPVTGNDWTAGTYGAYHSHPGNWSGDPFAVESFRKYLNKRYVSDEELQTAWGGDYHLTTVRPALPADMPSDAARLDLLTWYIGEMTDFSEFWLRHTRELFSGDLMLCLGGDGTPMYGADFAELIRLCSRYKTGIRITNEGSDPLANCVLTRWVASAAKQYGVWFGTEPAGLVDGPGTVARIFNASVSGADQLEGYAHASLITDDHIENTFKWMHEFKKRNPVWDIAVYYPQTDIRARQSGNPIAGQEFLGKGYTMRSYFDFAFISDAMIRDGGLKSHKALVILGEFVVPRDVLDTIKQWVDDGGLLLSYTPDTLGLIPFEGGDTPLKGMGIAPAEALNPDDVPYREWLSSELTKRTELPNATRRMVASHGKTKTILATLCRDNETSPYEIVWLNYTPDTIEREGVIIEPYSIGSLILEDATLIRRRPRPPLNNF